MKNKNDLIVRAGFSAALLVWLAFAQSSNAFGQASIDGKSYFATVCPTKTEAGCVQARDAIRSASVIVTGDDLEGDDWTYTASMMLSDPTIGEAKFKDGIKFTDAVNYFKSYLASPLTGDGNRIFVVRNAFHEVYGSTPLMQQEKAYVEQIKQKKIWYAPMVLAEQKTLYSNPDLRKQTIDRVYSYAMGRSAKPEETDYWMKRQSDFRQMFTATRSFLYTPAGAADLRDAVRRALNFLNKQTPSDAQIQAAIEKFKAGKKVHREMINQKLPFDF